MHAPFLRLTAFAGLLLLLESPLRAEQDILLAQRDGRVVTGLTDYFTASIAPRVFTGSFELDTESANDPYTTNPGIGALGNAALLPSDVSRLPARTTVSIAPAPLPPLPHHSLFYNGTSFAPLPEGVDLLISLGFNTTSLHLASDNPGTLALATTSSTGSMHVHPVFLLDSDTSPAPAGVYLFSLIFSVGNLTPSDPVTIVLGWDVPPAQVESVAALVQNGIPVPEPTGLAPLCLITAGLTLLGRQRH